MCLSGCTATPSAAWASLAAKAELWFDTERVHVFDPKTGENLTRNPDRTAGNDQPASVTVTGPPDETASG